MSVGDLPGSAPASSHARPEETPPSLNLRYRSVGAFLVAYSSHLSRGEIFLETTEPLQPGTRTFLRMHVPGATALEIQGNVAWTRPITTGPGQPAGMSVVLSSSMEAHGAAIDELASRYERIRILLAGCEPAPRALIGRYLRSILTCDVVEVKLPSGTPEIAREIQGGIDLAVIDFDLDRAAVESAIQVLKRRPVTADIPIVVLAQLERDRAHAAALGVDEVLPSPPLFGELRSIVIHALSRPATWTGA